MSWYIKCTKLDVRGAKTECGQHNKERNNKDQEKRVNKQLLLDTRKMYMPLYPPYPKIFIKMSTFLSDITLLNL